MLGEVCGLLAPDIRYSLNARLRDAIQSIIACETHEDLPQRLGADIDSVTIFMTFYGAGDGS